MTERDKETNPDLIVLIPYGLNVRLGPEGQSQTFLTVMSKMAIDAAVYMHKKTDARILIPGEVPFEDLTGTTELMVSRATKQGAVPDALTGLDALQDGRRLNNTYLQARGLAESVAPTDNSVVLALDYHMPRVKGALRAFGLSPDFKTVESVLEENDIRKYEKYYPLIAKLRRSELIVRVVTEGVGLSKGQIPNLITKRVGTRVVDMHSDSDGKLTIENGFVRAKRRKLESSR